MTTLLAPTGRPSGSRALEAVSPGCHDRRYVEHAGAGQGPAIVTRAAGGALEAAVLGVLWEAGDWRTPADVRAGLGPAHDVTYTTVMTVLVRLWKKKEVERTKTGRSFSYRALRSEDQYVAERMDAVLAAASDRHLALSQFVAGMSDAERAQLRRLVARRRSR